MINTGSGRGGNAAGAGSITRREDHLRCPHHPAFGPAVALLRKLDAAALDHPGGTLLAHLIRVRERLAAWGARPALQLAGLCHAFYGTDGFPTGLLPIDRRSELAAVIGAEAEELVYVYAGCDRDASYPSLAQVDARFRDRFTGRVFTPAVGSDRTVPN
ncbi:hypothetical protein SHKM778_46230 [Streptomyces sp. KM77-8]|uniref:DUF6817 domain-containing protein n=1 Tax=Streptomyces haneummycinicus TaxID=3074435 RepID=A0AAT9HLD4_9ACTN